MANTNIIIAIGDVLLINTVRLEIQDRCIIINGKSSDYQTHLKQIRLYKNHIVPLYHRSPRMIKKVDTEEVTINSPPPLHTFNKKGLLTTFSTTVLTLVVSIVIGMLITSGAMVLMTVVSSLVAIVTNVTKYINDKKEIHLKNLKREETYQIYLLQVRKTLYHKSKGNHHVLYYNNPTLFTIEEMLQTYNPRIYERTFQDVDFLHLCIGHKGSSLFDIKLRQEQGYIAEDHLKEQAIRLQQEFVRVNTEPLCIDLKKAHVGLVGDKKIVHQQLQAYIMQLTCFHSYHELEIIVVHHSYYKEELAYLKWYPHMKIKTINMSTNIYNSRICDQIMTSLYHMIKERKNVCKETNHSILFSPNILCIIDEPNLVLHHAIMEFLQSQDSELGYSLIYITDSQAKLPENMKTIIHYHDSKSGSLVMNEKEYTNTSFTLLSTKDIHFESNARMLAGLIHEEKVKSQIPENVDFLEMFNVTKVEQLPIQQLWQQNKIYETIAIPIGLRAKDDFVYLDLHEKSHGPHGLIAGTTGSGKSELIQTYILSLVIHFHPYDVGLLIIDYKGGGMANLFKKLPHVLGIVTNLDDNESTRALDSIKSELKRRQQIFIQVGVNHINAYTKLFKEKRITEPLPHLFIISDEFAELKKEQPEFMKELISTARIGRSLGIHLILATQKPTGVVDDQIWSNTNFKLCLKVQTEADSKEVLKTSDAATIKKAGRCYLQVGNNQIYELFQSAYSGVSYITTTSKSHNDNYVYIFDEWGQAKVINNDSYTTQNMECNMDTQLDVIVSHIQKEYQNSDVINVKKPWLKPLGTCISLPIEKQKEGIDVTCLIGMVDMPKKQLQEEYVLDLQKDGNIAYFASSGYGKTTFLSTIIISLARKNRANQLHFYILDFGNYGLQFFSNLAHTAGYITFDDDERLDKFMNVMQDVIKERKQILKKYQTQNFIVHNDVNETKLKAIVIIVDQFDMLKEKDIEVESYFSKLVRDGHGLGIYVVMTGSRFMDIRYATMSQFKTRIVGYLFDEAEPLQVIGRSHWKLPNSKGRMLVKIDDVYIAQMYIPAIFTNMEQYRSTMHKLVYKINQQNKGEKAEQLLMLPEYVHYHELVTYEKVNKSDIYLGLHKHSVKTVGYNSTTDPFLIIGPQRCGKTNALKIIYMQTSGYKYVFDTSRMHCHFVSRIEDVEYAYEIKGYQKIFNKLKETLRLRNVQYNKAYERNPQLIPLDFYEGLPKVTCFIDDIHYFSEIVTQLSEFALILPQMIEYGIGFVVCEDSSRSTSLLNITSIFRRTNSGLVLGACVMSNPFMITLNEVPSLGDAILCIMHQKQYIKMAQFEEGNR